MVPSDTSQATITKGETIGMVKSSALTKPKHEIWVIDCFHSLIWLYALNLTIPIVSPLVMGADSMQQRRDPPVRMQH